MKLQKREPFYVKDKALRQYYENELAARYIGYFCVRKPSGEQDEVPVDVFYKAKPSKGESSYVGVLVRDGAQLVVDAKGCFNEPMTGICEDNVVYISRYPDEVVTTPSGIVITGGPFDTKVKSGGMPAERKSEITKNIMLITKLVNELHTSYDKKELQGELRVWKEELEQELNEEPQAVEIKVVNATIKKSRFYFKKVRDQLI